MDLGLVVGVVGTLFGVASVVYAWYTNRQSSRQLQTEAARLRRLSEIMLQGMESAGWIKLHRDGAGEIAGLAIELAALVVGTAGTLTANLTVDKK